jgi:hypothetical protein
MDFLLSMKAGNFKMLCSSRRCWSFDQQAKRILHLEILSSAAVVAHAVVGLLTNNRSYQCFYPLLKLF